MTGALILDRFEPDAPSVTFSSLSGELKVFRSPGDASLLTLTLTLTPTLTRSSALRATPRC